VELRWWRLLHRVTARRAVVAHRFLELNKHHGVRVLTLTPRHARIEKEREVRPVRAVYVCVLVGVAV
jgi:hypothetical protein